MKNMGQTTNWKVKTNQQSINICLHNGLLQELDSLKRVTGTNRSEIIRTAIRQYVKAMKQDLVEAEKAELKLYQSHRRDDRIRSKANSQGEIWIKA